MLCCMLTQDDEAQGATQGELPYELLRRAANYEVHTLMMVIPFFKVL
jgi:hypothetical protein